MTKSDGSVVIDTVIDTSGFNKGVKDYKKGIDSVGTAARKLAGLFATVFAAGKLIQFGREAIELGSDLSEVQNVVDVTFEHLSEDVNQFAKNAITQFGLSETSAKQYASTMGAMLKSMGFTIDEAKDMGTTIAGLAGDLASFYNLSSEEAFAKIRSGISGETEPLKQLGINLNVANLEQYALAQGIEKSYSAMTQQEQALLRYNYLLSVTSDAQGDFARTSKGWANQTRILSENFNSLKATLGQGLINIFSPLLQLLNALISRLQVAAEAFRAFTVVVTGGNIEEKAADYDSLTESIEETADATEDAVKEQKKYLSGLDEIHAFSDSDDNIIAPNIAGAVGSSFDNAIQGGNKPTIVDGINESLQKMLTLLEPAKAAWNRFKQAIEPIINDISTGLKWAYDNVLLPFGTWTIADAVPAVLDTLGNALQLISKVGEAAAPTLKSIWDNFFAPAASFVAGAFVDTITAIGDFLGIIIDDEDAITMLSDLAIAIGAVVAATKLWEAAQLALNTALDANPIGAVIALLALLIPLLVEVDKHWDEIYSGFVDFDEWLTGQLTHDWTDTFGILGGGANALCDVIHGVYIFIRDTLGGLAEFLEGVFTGNWNKIWHGLGTVVSGVVKGILLVIVGVVNAVIWAINLLWEGVYSVIKGIVDGIGGIAGALGSLFGQDWSFSMPSDVPKIPYIPTDWADIPWLAKGAVIPPNAPFTAVLGDQRHGTNVEAPLETIKDAVRQVLAEKGGESGGGENVYRFTAQIGRRVVFDEIITEAKLRQSATGKNPFALA